MVTSSMEPSSSVMRARAALPTVDALLFALLLVGVSGSAGADGLISAGIVSPLCVCVWLSYAETVCWMHSELV